MGRRDRNRTMGANAVGEKPESYEVQKDSVKVNLQSTVRSLKVVDGTVFHLVKLEKDSKSKVSKKASKSVVEF